MHLLLFYLSFCLEILTVLSKPSTPCNLYWLKDLNSWSPFSIIISRLVPSLVVTDINTLEHTYINDIQEHWMPVVAPYCKSPWWCVAQTNFVALPNLSSALIILKLKLFTSMTCCFQMPKVKNIELVLSKNPSPGL